MSREGYAFGAFELYPSEYQLLKDGVAVSLGQKTFELLVLLVQAGGHLLERKALAETLWPDTFVEDANVTVQVSMLRKALGPQQNGEPFIETIPRRGYRFTAAVRRIPAGAEPSPKSAPAGDRQAAGGAQPATRVMVMPFRVLRPDPEIDFLAFSLPDAVSASLAGLTSVIVRSTLVAARFAGAPLDLAIIAREAQVDLIVTGTLVRADEDVRVSAQLVDVGTGTLLWSHTSQVALRDIFRLQDQLAERIVRSLPFGDESTGQSRRSNLRPATDGAYVFFLRANQLAYEVSRWDQARDLYLKALGEDPNYAPAWARLARCYRLLGKFAASEESSREQLALAEHAFERALALDPDSSVAHNLYSQLEVDLGRAPAAMVRLIHRARAYPWDAEVFAGLVHATRFCGLLDESLAAYRRARALDPMIPTSVHHTYWMRGNFEQALAETYGDIGYLPGLALVSLGRERDALAALEWRERETGDSVVRLYIGSLRALLDGRRADSLDLTRQAVMRLRDPEAVFYLARQVARLGDSAEALHLLRQTIDGGFFCYRTLAVDPWLDSLRDTAAFRGLLQEAQHRSHAARLAFDAAGGEEILR